MEEAIRRVHNWLPGQALDISHLGIQTFPRIPNGVEILYCYNNKLTYLPPLPSSVRIIDCSNNELEAISEYLPYNLISFNCSNNKLERLPKNLPQNLITLLCSNNMLTELPQLPHSLERLYCDRNYLIRFPRLPYNLRCLCASYNNIEELPEEIPESVRELYCAHNKLKNLPEYLPKFKFYSFEKNEFPSNIAFEPIEQYHKRVLEYVERKNTVERTAKIKEELIQKAWHPTRVTKWIEQGIDITDL
jgi:hypothetical protein